MLDESRCMLHNIILWHCTLLLFECQTARRLKSTPLTRLCCHPRCKRRLMRQNDWPIGLLFRGMAAGGVGDVTGWRRGSGLKYIYIYVCTINVVRDGKTSGSIDLWPRQAYIHTHMHTYTNIRYTRITYIRVLCVCVKDTAVYI